jgi:diadenosine tetraphosphate (Ap4A) HIT family hydrolase
MIKYATLQAAQEGKVAPWDLEVPELSTQHVTVFRDRFPVTAGHLLFVPRNNTDEGIVVCLGTALIAGQQMVARDECDAFNVGLNMGEAAGQTVMYPHVHLMPRRAGDTVDPVGGVRGIIPGQANYRKGDYQLPD